MLFTLLTPSITTTSYAQTGSTAALETIESTYAQERNSEKRIQNIKEANEHLRLAASYFDLF